MMKPLDREEVSGIAPTEKREHAVKKKQQEIFGRVSGGQQFCLRRPLEFLNKERENVVPAVLTGFDTSRSQSFIFHYYTVVQVSAL